MKRESGLRIELRLLDTSNDFNRSRSVCPRRMRCLNEADILNPLAEPLRQEKLTLHE
jgi:hypothetical protein